MKAILTLLTIISLGLTAANAQKNVKTIFRYGEEVSIKQDTAITVKKFTVTPREGKVYLGWVVYNNLKNGMYIIERAVDGQEFEVIGFKKGIATSLPLDLAFYYTDNYEPKGKVTYKVTHIADDNTYFEFPEVTIKGGKNSKQVAVAFSPAVLSTSQAMVPAR